MIDLMLNRVLGYACYEFGTYGKKQKFTSDVRKTLHQGDKLNLHPCEQILYEQHTDHQ